MSVRLTVVGIQASHTRPYGSFPRLIARYVRDLGVISLEQAVSQASTAAANDVLAYDRGRIAVGLADVIVFDYEHTVDGRFSTSRCCLRRCKACHGQWAIGFAQLEIHRYFTWASYFADPAITKSRLHLMSLPTTKIMMLSVSPRLTRRCSNLCRSIAYPA